MDKKQSLETTAGRQPVDFSCPPHPHVMVVACYFWPWVYKHSTWRHGGMVHRWVGHPSTTAKSLLDKTLLDKTLSNND